MVKQIVALDCNMAEDTRDKLVSISSMDSYLQHDLESSGQGVLDTASEVEGSTTRYQPKECDSYNRKFRGRKN